MEADPKEMADSKLGSSLAHDASFDCADSEDLATYLSTDKVRRGGAPRRRSWILVRLASR